MASSTDTDEVFAFGVASGDPAHDRVVLWTGVRHGAEDDPVAVTWRVRRAGTDTLVATGRAAIDGGRPTPHDVVAGVVNVAVDGLQPGTRYEYWFEAAGRRSPVGTTTTLPDRTDEVQVGLACCARRPTAPFDPYGDLADHAPDVIVHLGDYVYEGADPEHEPTHRCRSAADFWRRYAQYRADPHLQRLHATSPWVIVWDDHEIAADSWGSGAPDVPGEDEWQARRRAGALAFDAWLPQRPSTTGPTRLDRRLRFGDLLDVIVLDARHAGRSRPRSASGPTLVPPDDHRRILSDSQWDWLGACLQEAPGWVLLATQTQVAPLHLARLPDPRRRLRITPLVNPGQWDGYPTEQRRVADLLAPYADRLVVVTGDLHGRFVSDVAAAHERSATRRRILEVTTPSIASVTFADAVRRRIPVPAGILRRWLAHVNPHITEMDLTARGSTIVTATRTSLHVDAVENGRRRCVARLERGGLVAGSARRPAGR